MILAPSHEVVGFAVNPESDALTIGRVTLGGRVVDSRRVPTRVPLRPEEAVALAAVLIAEMRDHAPTGERTGGIGVAVPGLVISETRHVISAPSLGWYDVDFGRMLAERTDLPTWMENNARVITEAEHRQGAARGLTDFIYIFAGAGGLGGGIVLNNRLLLGSGGFAGELGHFRVNDSPKRDSLGLNGTFEALVQRGDLLSAFGKDDLTDAELDDLIQNSDGHEIEAIATRQLQVVARVIGNLSNALNPQAIVLGGFLGSLHRRYPRELGRFLRIIVLPTTLQPLGIATSTSGTEMVMRGAAELVFSAVEADPLDFAFAASALA